MGEEGTFIAFDLRDMFHRDVRLQALHDCCLGELWHWEAKSDEGGEGDGFNVFTCQAPNSLCEESLKWRSRESVGIDGRGVGLWGK